MGWNIFSKGVLLSALMLLLRVQHTCGGRILYLSFPQFSHLHVLTCMKDELKQYGHELWLTYPEYLSGHSVLKDFNSIKMESLGDVNIDKTFFAKVINSYLDPEEITINSTLLERFEDFLRRFVSRRAPPFSLLKDLRDILLQTLSDTAFIESVKEKKFDLIVVDGDLGLAYSTIPYKLDIPFCYIGITLPPWQSGTPTLPSFVPVSGIGTTDNMSFVQRLISMLAHVLFMAPLPLMSSTDVTTVAPEKPYLTPNQLMGKAKMWFIMQDVVADFPRPLMPNSKLVGGLCARDAKTLPGQFQDFCDKSKHGVVIVSFGGSLKELPKHLSDKLYKAFSATKYDFIWRSNLRSNDSNILMRDWLPQNDLLGHPKTKLFITHGGSNGVFESIYHGVPMLGVPIFADQPQNTQKFQNKGYGLVLDIHDNTAQEFDDAINNIIQTPSYKANIMKASSVFRNRPLSPRQEAAYWMDYLIQHGDRYIRSAGLDLPWYQYLCLDVLLFLFLTLAVITTLLVTCVRCCCRCICVRKTGGKSKKD